MDIADPDFSISSPLALKPREVHLWRVNLERVAVAESRWMPVLSADEQARAARFHFHIDRQYFTATRAILRRLVAAYLHCQPGELTFIYSAKEKPALGGSCVDNGLEFNVSHSGTMALLAFTLAHPIGVDVEVVRNDFDTAAIAARFFSTVEQQQLANLPAEQRHEAFFRCWTRKEAYIKATGDGLSLPLRQFDVSLALHDQNALLATRPDETEAKRWALRDVAVKSGYAAAICVSGKDWKLVEAIGT